MPRLYIQAETGGPSWQVWPEAEVIPPGSIRESVSYVFELRDSDDALSADLFIDDVAVEALRSRQPRVARWRWLPGFHAGVVEAVLRLPGEGNRRFEITTDPDLRKLTREDFDAMVREILEDTHALFAISAFRKGIARQKSSRPPPLARLEYLRSRLNAIIDTVAAIARAPRHFLQIEEVTVPVHRAARATGPEIIKSFRSGAIRTESTRPSRLPLALKGRLPASITVRRRCNSADIPEHRQIKACLKSCSAWLTGVADVIASRTDTSDLESAHTAGSWAVRTKHIARALNDAAASPLFVEVGDASPTLRMSSLFRNDPVYQRFYRLWQEMNLGLAAVFGDFLQMPIAKTYELYELWCFLRLLRAAVEEYSPGAIDTNNLFTEDENGSGAITILAGAITVPIGPDKLLSFQRRYREYWSELDGEGSFSRAMIPDLVLAGKGLGSSGRRVIVLDAKYRIDAGLSEALTSIHTYRDALVKAESGGIEGIVTAAYLLTPHVPVLGADFQSTPLPGRLFHPEYRGQFRFGAVTLRPGMRADELSAVLRNIVFDAGVEVST